MTATRTTLKSPVKVAIEFGHLVLEFPDGHQLKLHDTERGWTQLRDILHARAQMARVQGIGTKAKPIQHSVDLKVIHKLLDDEALAADELLKELGL